MTLGDTHLRFAWLAWRLATSTFVLRGHLAHTTLSHTHTTLSHTQTHLCHTQICHTPSFTHLFVTHHLSHTPFSHTIFVTHLLSHTTLSHTFFHTPLCHTPSFTHHFVTHHLAHTTLSHHLSHTHTTLSYTTVHIQLFDRSSTTSFVYPSFLVPLELFVSAYWKKLTCGVIRPFNFEGFLHTSAPWTVTLAKDVLDQTQLPGYG